MKRSANSLRTSSINASLDELSSYPTNQLSTCEIKDTHTHRHTQTHTHTERERERERDRQTDSYLHLTVPTLNLTVSPGIIYPSSLLSIGIYLPMTRTSSRQYLPQCRLCPLCQYIP